MKNRTKRKSLVFIGLIGLMFILFTVNSFNDNLQGIDNGIDMIPQTSDSFWEYYDATITINDTDVNDWDYHVANYDWCSGSGTWNDPYTIENLTIDGAQNQNVGLFIQDSEACFTVINCTFHNFSAGGLNAGIILQNCSNGLLTQNNLSNNLANGMVIFENSNNNSITENDFYNNTDHDLGLPAFSVMGEFVAFLFNDQMIMIYGVIITQGFYMYVRRTYKRNRK